MAETLVRWADAFPWWVWVISGCIGLLGTFALGIKGYHRAALGAGY